MESNKWIATVASIWIQCICSTTSVYSIYSPILKSTQDYSQSTLDTLSVFKDIGANAGTLSGLLYSAVTPSSSRLIGCGPWVVHLAGAIQCFVGYFLMWLSVIGVIHRPPVLVMCVFLLVAAHSLTFFSTANVVTAVQNFPDYRGTIVGIIKGCVGLSGAILVQVYQTTLKGKQANFLLMLALLPTLVSLLLMCLVRVYQRSRGDDKKHLNGFSAVALIIAAYLMIILILENVFTLPLWARILTFVLLLVLLASPLRIATKAQSEDSPRLSHTSSIDENPLMEESEDFSATEDPIESNEVPSEPSHEEATSSDKMLQDGENLNLLQAMRTVNFWLLFISMLCGMGSGLATINNVSQIGESLGYTTMEIDTLVSLWSIWGFVGRFGAGYGSDILLHTRGWARPLLMAITLAAMTAGHVIIAIGLSGNLYLGSILVGVCFGSQSSLMPTITSEIFGVVHMGTISNTIAIAGPVGSYVLSVRVIGYIYDKEASGEQNTCFGTQCFMLSFLIIASATLFGSFVALALFFRTKRFYKLVMIRRLQHSALL
ncbi:hypothetical protein L1049_028406 [Liquidambar formosana]|uniref:Nodulin-like domain-containing protein n=1 Tax=Liquidambar formosana TaxID=63359 RepID=A0AAP0WTD4_LIQFO